MSMRHVACCLCCCAVTGPWSGRPSRLPTSKWLRWSGDAAQGLWEKSVERVSFFSFLFRVTWGWVWSLKNLMNECHLFYTNPSASLDLYPHRCLVLCLVVSFGSLPISPPCNGWDFDMVVKLFWITIESLFRITFGGTQRSKAAVERDPLPCCFWSFYSRAIWYLCVLKEIQKPGLSHSAVGGTEAVFLNIFMPILSKAQREVQAEHLVNLELVLMSWWASLVLDTTDCRFSAQQRPWTHSQHKETTRREI